MDHYAKLLKPKRLNELTEMQKLRLRRQHEETQRALNQALLHVHQQAPSALSPSSPVCHSPVGACCAAHW